MAINYTKIKLGHLLYRFCYPLYKVMYFRYKRKNDKNEIRVLKDAIHRGDTVLDIGANTGFYALLFSNLAGDQGHVICFEPDRKNYLRLAKNKFPRNNISMYNMAVSDKNEIIKIYRSKLLNVDHRTYPVNNAESVSEIEAVALDEFLEKKLVMTADVIKIDIQGYEMTAFKGMTRILRQSRNLKILSEVWPHGLRKAGSSSIEYYRFFKERDFTIYSIGDNGEDELDESFVIENDQQPFEFSYNILIVKKDKAFTP